ncbi:MAG: phage tail protein [Bacteroidota bacterium]
MDAYIGEIRAFAIGYIPQGWLACYGQVVSVQQYPALFSLIGNVYGGTVNQTFALPNFQGFAPIGLGTGTNLTPRQMAHTYGAVGVTLSTVNQLPPHNHQLSMQNPVLNNLQTNMLDTPVANSSWLARAVQVTSNTTVSPVTTYTKSTGQAFTGPLHNATIGIAGGNTGGGVSAHENRQPYLTLSFCICATEGEYPSFN